MPKHLQMMLARVRAMLERSADDVPKQDGYCNAPMFGSRCMKVTGHWGPHMWPDPNDDDA